MQTKKKILVLTSTFPRWKGDKEPPFVYELSWRLASNFEVHVLAPHAKGAKKQEHMQGVIVHRFQYFLTNYQTLAYDGGILSKLKHNKLNYLLVPFFMLFEWISIIRIMKKYSFHAIHAHWIFPQGFIALLARIFSKHKPFILCTSHGGDLFGLRSKPWQYLKRWVLNQVDAVTVVSQAMQNEVSKLKATPKQLKVIPMGVDLKNQFKPNDKVNSNPKNLLFVGRLVEKKGVTYLIEAINIIRKTHPDITLRIIGDGTEKQNLLQQVHNLNLEKNIKFIGAVENQKLPSFYQQASIVVFPSIEAVSGDQEGFGLVLVEALGCGCAVICTDLPAMTDIVKSGESGLTVPQKDISSLVDKVCLLIHDSFLRERLAKQGRKNILKKYDWTHITLYYSEIFH